SALPLLVAPLSLLLSPCVSCTRADVPDDGVIPRRAHGPAPSARNSLVQSLSNTPPPPYRNWALEFVARSHQSTDDRQSPPLPRSGTVPASAPQKHSSSSSRKSAARAHDAPTSNPMKSLLGLDRDARAQFAPDAGAV